MVNESSHWQLSGNAAESFELYSKYMLEPWVPALLKAVRLQSGERVHDIACDNGFVARQAAECVGVAGTVTGVDINVGMVHMVTAHTTG